uniref:Uncharacterized protein n=1 Tax=Eutreptiella gymnastica TaxID=73025 RepID=A0A7S1IAJ5_9EUGL|mmetsp:Transcript_141383/g.246468  ORF Transcript_141383/g.246468 Transcript_141383/m.246468 type:complete len:214 (+) Transcript_141383:92-733(+)
MQRLYQSYLSFKAGHRPEVIAIGGSSIFHILHIMHRHTEGLVTEKELADILSDTQSRWSIREPGRVAHRIMQLCGQSRIATASRYYHYKIQRRPYLGTKQASSHKTGTAVSPRNPEVDRMPVCVKEQCEGVRRRCEQVLTTLLHEIRKSSARHEYPDPDFMSMDDMWMEEEEDDLPLDIWPTNPYNTPSQFSIDQSVHRSLSLNTDAPYSSSW